MEANAGFRSAVVGEGPLVLACADALLSRGHVLAALISREAVVRRYAEEHGVLWLNPEEDYRAKLEGRELDYLFSVANLDYLPPEVLKLAQKGAINFHDSLLPRHAGVHATSWVLMEGEAEHGVTWHVMGVEVDAGPILKQRRIAVDPEETAFTLNKKCLQAGMESFTELVGELERGEWKEFPQRVGERSYHGRWQRPPGGGVVCWERPAAEIAAMVRALDFGSHANTLGTAKLWDGKKFWVIADAELVNGARASRPGEIVRVSEAGLVVGTGSERGQVLVSLLRSLDGAEISIGEWAAQSGWGVGGMLPGLSGDDLERLERVGNCLAPAEKFWVEKLGSLRPLRIPFGGAERESERSGKEQGKWGVLPLSEELAGGRKGGGADLREWVLSAFVGFLGVAWDREAFDLGFRDEAVGREVNGLEGLFAPVAPFGVELEMEEAFEANREKICAELQSVRGKLTYARDVGCRYANLRKRGWKGEVKWPVTILYGEGGLEWCGSGLVLRLGGDPKSWALLYDVGVVGARDAERLWERFKHFCARLNEAPNLPLCKQSYLSDAERECLLTGWRGAGMAPRAAGAGEQDQARWIVEGTAGRHPDLVALVFGDREMTYGELNERANQVGHFLRKRGVGPEVLVGVCMSRSLEMVVALLGILKAGGAYVPLDPDYPKERLEFMIEDSGVKLIMTQSRLREEIPGNGAELICLDADWGMIAEESREPVESGVKPENLAYVIYTSGSTGKPKGVMIEHRNVMNFFTGMDARVGGERPGTLLAVTSISFDISVLELFWTLARGYKVVLQPEQTGVAQRRVRGRAIGKKLDFSLFYFASDEGEQGGEKYRLLLEGAKFADEKGFSAIWTPERHFHAFGGLYPNPSVTSAAIAAITRRVKIRAGSVVLPLHHAVRVAEEWSVVDNLSKGRVGISFASGWQANDFVLAPERYRKSKEILLQELETVRKLWRGEGVVLRNGKGEEVEVRVLPRPVQRELPFWLTAAGNPETFRMAGELGANLLTHLLGQKLEELSAKIEMYREAWKKAGHAGEGTVTLMLHTYVGESLEQVREQVRVPFSNYLRSSVDLIKNAPTAFPTFRRAPSEGLDRAFRSGGFQGEDMEALVAHAFDRYFETSAMFGTVEGCLGMVERVRELGVDEVACLIDFGVDHENATQGLELLNEVRERSQNEEGASGMGMGGVAAEIRRHGVTHLQCTPSLARMILAEPDGAEGLGQLEKLLLGGEALPLNLAEELGRVVKGEIHNMYGPTESTVWSTTTRLEKGGGEIHIGRPIANTELYVLDKWLRPTPVGVAGELFIGGAGLARGYWRRAELTAEKFIENPFGKGRLYRTGDLVRYREDGNLEYLGRLDHQVKIRGHRIELGEIEAVLGAHPGVKEAVVMAREESMESKRLAAYVVLKNGPVQAAELRGFLETRLPEYMAPQQWYFVKALPLTPNGKIDRKALLRLERMEAPGTAAYEAPASTLEAELAEIWRKELGLERVGRQDSFFDLGGNSLLAVQIAFKIRESLGVELPLHLFFEFPTVKALAGKLEEMLLAQTGEEDLEALLSEVEGLSEDEVKAAAGLDVKN